MKHDYLVVGCGIFGSVFAREMKNAGKKVLIIEKRGHIAGNCYTEERHGVNVHAFGPHCFHTNSDKIWEYVNQFAKFNNFTNRVKAWSGGKLYSMPINLNTIYQATGISSPQKAREYFKSNCIPCENPKNIEEFALSAVGPLFYDLLIKEYTKKQWMRHPKDLPAFIIKRLPIRLTFDDNYYECQYQGIPIGGYTKMISNILDGIKIELGTSLESLGGWEKYAKKLVYTGKIDELFNYEEGELEYRTQEFHHEAHEGDYQGNAVINYTDDSVPWTRITEHKHFEFGTQEKTIITKEYPVAWSKEKEALYPVNDEKNTNLYQIYKKKLANHSNIIGGGRLCDFKYFDMDAAIASSLKKTKEEINL